MKNKALSMKYLREMIPEYKEYIGRANMGTMPQDAIDLKKAISASYIYDFLHYVQKTRRKGVK